MSWDKEGRERRWGEERDIKDEVSQYKDNMEPLTCSGSKLFAIINPFTTAGHSLESLFRLMIPSLVHISKLEPKLLRTILWEIMILNTLIISELSIVRAF